MKIAEGLYSVAYTKGGRVHCFLVDTGIGLILIDTGYTADAGPIIEEVKAMGQVRRNILAVVLTHAHKSHISGLAEISGWKNAPPEWGRGLKGLDSEGRPLPTVPVCAAESEIPIIEGRAKATPVGWRMPRPFNAEVMFLQAMLNWGIGSHTPVRVDQRLKEGDKVGPLEVLEVPGHTPGSLAMWWPERKALFAGDTVASWPALGPWESFNLDPVAAKRSVAKMAELSSVQYLLVGHGEPITDGAHDILKLLAKEPQ
jgi:glyoxylase-like metal-dependent hydrolase (beta-lactamase superfamily II)